MRLIEKKCSNCGAKLEFKDTDKNCKCDHCGSSFVIERDTSIDDLSKQFDLKPVSKIFSIFYTLSFIESLVIFLFAVIIIGVIFFQIFNFSKNDNKLSSSVIRKNENRLLKDAKGLSGANISAITRAGSSKISRLGEGVNDTNHSYKMTGDAKKEKIYVAYKDNENYVIVIYKAIYHDFFHQENSYTVYVPVVFENVMEDVYFSLGGGEITAPEFYFNSEKSSYTYGYASFDDAYNGAVRPLEKNYTITEK